VERPISDESNGEAEAFRPGGGSAFPFDGPAEIIAHRGFSARAPENTLAALELGVASGADAVEFDLHATRDGVAVLLHDTTLDRTTDRTGAIADVTVEELAGTDAGSWFSPEFAGEPVPTVRDALRRIAPAAVRIYPEVKRTERPDELRAVARMTRELELIERTVFISMDWDALATIREEEPEARIGYIVERPRRTEDAFQLARDDDLAMVHFDARILLALPRHADRARALGIPLAAWTVNSVRTAERLLELGVPRITTNEVADLVAWKAAL
jgi:glycerophosphoryl diester phosphodiesterase